MIGLKVLLCISDLCTSLVLSSKVITLVKWKETHWLFGKSWSCFLAFTYFHIAWDDLPISIPPSSLFVALIRSLRSGVAISFRSRLCHTRLTGSSILSWGLMRLSIVMGIVLLIVVVSILLLLLICGTLNTLGWCSTSHIRLLWLSCSTCVVRLLLSIVLVHGYPSELLLLLGVVVRVIALVVLLGRLTFSHISCLSLHLLHV